MSRLSEVADKVKTLQQGADDYLAKPFSSQELLIRIQRLLEKEKVLPQDYYSVGEVKLYPETGQLLLRDKKITLRKRESQVLACLLKKPKQVVTRAMLIDQIWRGQDDIPCYSTLDVYVRRIRMVLGQKFNVIKTVRGFGYMAAGSEAGPTNR